MELKVISTSERQLYKEKISSPWLVTWSIDLMVYQQNDSQCLPTMRVIESYRYTYDHVKSELSEPRKFSSTPCC